jgi:AcrR family transcriptional regulator
VSDLATSSETSLVGTRTDRRRERTRRRLIESGCLLISERGVGGLRIQDITEEADIALGSFYNYFATKEELVEAVLAESLETLARTTVLETLTEDADPAVTTAMAARKIIRLAFDDPTFARLLINLNHADVLFERAMRPYAFKVIDAGVSSGRFHTPNIDVSLNLIIGGSLSLIRAILSGEFEDGVEITHAEVILRGLGVDPGEAAAISRAAVP